MRTIIPDGARLIPNAAELVFHGQIFDVYQWQQEQFDGSFATYEMLRRPDTVYIIGIKDDKIVITKQEQPSMQSFYGFPGGRHDVENETELEAAQREMLEETGMRFNSWKLIDIVQPESKIEWFIYTFLATDFNSQIEQTTDAGEKIVVMEKTFEEALQLKSTLRNMNAFKDVLESAGSIEGLLSLPEYAKNS